MAEWPTDDQLRDAAHRVEQAFLAIEVWEAQDVAPSAEFPMALPRNPETVPQRPVAADAEPFTWLYPAMMMSEYEKLDTARTHLRDEAEDTRQDIARMLNKGWSGAAANKFQEQVENIREFIDGQRDNFELHQRSLLAEYKLAVLARQDYLDFTDATIQACEQFQEAREAEAEEFGLALLGGVVGSVLSAGASGLVQTGIAVGASAIGTAVSSVPTTLSGGGLEELALSYRDTYRKLTSKLQDEIEQATRANFEVREKILENRIDLFTPLPPRYRDVHSPDFRYENFSQEFRANDLDLSRAVTESAKDRAANRASETDPRETDESERIQRRLSGEY